MTSPKPPLQLTVRGAMAEIVFDRPERRNALDLAMAEALHDAVREVAGASEVRVLVLRGNGRGFCSGGDLAWFAEQPDGLGEAAERLLRAAHEAVLALLALPLLRIAAVHGITAGAGLSLALAADHIVAADDARFRPAYGSLGVTPDCGGTLGAVRRLGVAGAERLYLVERELTAERALALGLVDEVVPEASLASHAWQVARRLAELHPTVVQAFRRLLRGAASARPQEQLEAERRAFVHLVRQPPCRAAIDAFLSPPAATPAR